MDHTAHSLLIRKTPKLETLWQRSALQAALNIFENDDGSLRQLKPSDDFSDNLVVPAASLVAFKRLSSAKNRRSRRATLDPVDALLVPRHDNFAKRLTDAAENLASQTNDSDVNFEDVNLLRKVVETLIFPSLNRQLESTQSSKRLWKRSLINCHQGTAAMETITLWTMRRRAIASEPMAPLRLNEDIDMENELWSGYAEKRGYMRKGFKRRYFTLTVDSFEYFKTSGDMNPRGTILSTEIVAVSRLRDAVSSEYTLEIVTFERVYFLRAYCENDVIALLDAFRELKERTGFVFQLDYGLDDEDDQWSRNSFSSHAISHLQRDMSGGLLKRGKINKAWKRRYCHLLIKEKILMYSKSDSQGAPSRGTIDLTTASDVRKSHVANLAFEIITPRRVGILRVDVARA